MIAGVVNAAYEPVITLAVQGPAGRTRDIDAVIDTGFGGFLTLPPALIWAPASPCWGWLGSPG